MHDDLRGLRISCLPRLLPVSLRQSSQLTFPSGASRLGSTVISHLSACARSLSSSICTATLGTMHPRSNTPNARAVVVGQRLGVSFPREVRRAHPHVIHTIARARALPGLLGKAAHRAWSSTPTDLACSVLEHRA